MNKENVDKFRELFVEFEKATKNLVKDKNIDIHDAIEKLREQMVIPYSKESEFLHFCRDCRNRISHVNDDYKYIIYTDEFIDKFERILEQIKNPPTAYSMATKNITSAMTTDNVREYMNIMNQNNYTHIPIYQENKLIGIFSENSIFNYLLKEEIIEVSNETTFNDIISYIDFDNSKETVQFISRKELYNSVINNFVKEFKNGEKLSCIMITENGIIGEKVIGLITAWDIIGKN